MATRSSPGSKPDPSLARGALVPLAIVTAVLLYYVIQVSLLTVSLVVLPFVALFAVAPWWARVSVREFDRDSVTLLAGDDLDGLRARLGNAWGMRLFASPAVFAERAGRIAAAIADHETAYRHYERAVRGYEGDPPVSVALGFANACYHLERHEAAAHWYGHLIDRGHDLPHVAERRELALLGQSKK